MSGFRFKGAVQELPKAFRDWMGDNAERVERMKQKPYFISDNEGLINPKRGRIALTEEQKAYRKNLQREAVKMFGGTEIENVFHIRITTNGIKEFLNQPHKHYFEKNERIREIDVLLKEAAYLGINLQYKKEGVVYSYIFETEIAGEKSWIIVREYTDGSISLHGVSDNPKIKDGLIKK